MNIFVLDRDPYIAASYMNDKHVVKMILESCQILSTALRHHGFEDPLLYRRTHIHHPCVKWVIESRSNYLWLLEHLNALHNEYKLRYMKVHRSYRLLIEILSEVPLSYPDIGLTEFVLAMPEKYKVKDPVESYRNYYFGDKARFSTWTTPSTVPKWFTMKLNAMLQSNCCLLEKEELAFST